MKKILVFIAIVVVVGAAWWLVRPLFVDTAVDEAFPTLEEVERMTPQERALIQEEMMEHAAAMPPTIVMEDFTPKPTVAEVATGPTRITEGIFEGADAFHQGSGRVGIYTLEDGSHIARFEDFSVTNGPDLRVLLTTGENPTGRDSLGEYIELDKLKGNQGNQNYEIPDDVDVSQYKSVVIYCRPFHVVFATASLER